jgi:hypothetical protein
MCLPAGAARGSGRAAPGLGSQNGCSVNSTRHRPADTSSGGGRQAPRDWLGPVERAFIPTIVAQSPALRYDEVNGAVAEARQRGFTLPHVCVVPVRMQEAWLLLDEAAIRRASGNPNGRMALALPGPHAIEATPNPKTELHGLLTTASGRHGRRRKKFRPQVQAHLVTRYVRDFGCLRALPGFQRLETGVESLLSAPDLDAGS